MLSIKENELPENWHILKDKIIEFKSEILSKAKYSKKLRRVSDWNDEKKIKSSNLLQTNLLGHQTQLWT